MRPRPANCQKHSVTDKYCTQKKKITAKIPIKVEGQTKTVSAENFIAGLRQKHTLCFQKEGK